MKNILKSLLVIFAFFVCIGCGKEVKDDKTGEIEGIKYTESDKQTDYIKINVRKHGVILAELYPEVAPITVDNFKSLVSNSFYDGLIFHRVIKNFMIQTGDPTGVGYGGSNNNITGEFSENGIDNELKHERGIISMARKGANPDTEETRNSASSQFFIVHKDTPSLDGKYAAFGKVIAGLDVVDKIAEVSTNTNDKPINDQVIESIKFITIEKTKKEE